MRDDISELVHQIKVVNRTNMMIVAAVAVLASIQLYGPRYKGHDIHGGTGQGGNVENHISVPDDKERIRERAEARGYYKASEYASYTGVSLETVYRHAQDGRIPGAVKVDGGWRIMLPQSSR